LAVASGIAVIGWLIVWAVVMPGRLAPPLRGSDLAGVRDVKARLEAIDARTRLHHDLRNGALQLLTVLAVLVGAGLGFRQLAEDRDQASKDRDQAIQDRQLTRQGQASERFTRAIDQLGSSRVETRIGGIYGLDQIAEQTPENTGPVGEVLLAWLNSRPRRREPSGNFLREDAPDVQAALTVLTGGQRYSTIVANRLDLQGMALARADLRGADLTGAHLDDANLNHAQLDGANLREAFLRRAQLREALLRGADLGFAFLHGADLRGANLTGVDLTGAILDRTDLRGAFLHGAFLDGALLDGADLRGAYFDAKTRWPAGFN
jgi:hypothetical protein